VTFTCDGAAVDIAVTSGESLLTVLRERLGIVSAKDGCAPQGQCGCCTVLVDGEARVACVTPVARVEGRVVTTVDGLDREVRDRIVGALGVTGGAQCGFCTPGIVVRAAAMAAKGKSTRTDVDRALAAHLCRCTGWQTIIDALALARDPDAPGGHRVGSTAAERRAALEGGVAQSVGPDVPLGQGGFADDLAPRDALVAVPRPPDSDAPSTSAAGIDWVIGDSLVEARALAGKVQGRRTTVDPAPRLEVPERPDGGVCLATTWVEPAYLEPDASWCVPGGEPASPLANGGAFGGKESTPVTRAARELADGTGRTVRALFSREDVVRLGPKRPPIAAHAVVDGAVLHIDGVVVGDAAAYAVPPLIPYALDVDARWRAVSPPGPPTAPHPRFVLADHQVLVDGAIDAAGLDRASLVADARARGVLLDTCASSDDGALAGAHVALDAAGVIEHLRVRIACGDPLDDVVLRSYAVGAAHMALGWVLTEQIAVDPERGEVFDLTIRSFGVIRARNTPRIDIELVADDGPPRARASDAVFAAVAAATWNALAAHAGVRPERFPARDTAAARALSR